MVGELPDTAAAAGCSAADEIGGFGGEGAGSVLGVREGCVRRVIGGGRANVDWLSERFRGITVGVCRIM